MRAVLLVYLKRKKKDLDFTHCICLGSSLFLHSSGAKDNYPQVPDSAATPLLTEMTFLRNQTGIVKAKVDAQRELAKKRASHVGLKLELKHEKQLSDRLQREIESLREQKIKLNSNRTALGKAYLKLVFGDCIIVKMVVFKF